jgi:hypothetical protein
VNSKVAVLNMLRHSPGLMLITLLLCNAGCRRETGPKRIAVAGTVTLDDSPLIAGQIRLIPREPSSGPGAMAEIAGGIFVFTKQTGPIVGEHRVEIEESGFHDFPIDDEAAFAASMVKTGKSPLARNPIPSIYNSASTLTARIDDVGKLDLKFELKSRP